MPFTRYGAVRWLLQQLTPYAELRPLYARDTGLNNDQPSKVPDTDNSWGRTARAGPFYTPLPPSADVKLGHKIFRQLEILGIVDRNLNNI